MRKNVNKQVDKYIKKTLKDIARRYELNKLENMEFIDMQSLVPIRESRAWQ